jgi:anti-sigma regulatory factor (Ser/Thr protein kinase)
MVLPPFFAYMLTGVNVWLHLPFAGLFTLLIVPVITFAKRRKGLSVPLLLPSTPGGTALAFSVERDGVKASEASAAVQEFCMEQELPKKQTMLVALAIEEMVILIADNDRQGGNISVRLIRFSGGLVLRLRDGGKRFNPIDYCKKRLEDASDIEAGVDFMGVKYIIEAAEHVYYRETFGVNNLVVIL